MEKPISDPAIPYTGPIFGGKLTPGRMVRIQGTLPSVAYRFNVYLQCGPESNPRDDVAVQLAVHILDGYVAINSMQSGVWDEEQRHQVVPIRRAERFEVILMCDESVYKIAINGQHFCDFPQRIHHNRISHLSVDGDVSVIQITYESSALPTTQNSSTNVPKTSEDDFEIVDQLQQPPPAYNTNLHGAAPASIYVGSPVPLNAAVPSFRTMNRKYENRWCFCIGLAVIIAFGMFIMILSGFLVR